MRTRIAELSEEILQRLLLYKEKYPDFTFSLRERDSVLSQEKRLENGFWFQGSDYIYVPLFSKGDNDRKIKSIGFVITFTEDNSINNNYIEVSFKGKNFDNEEINFHKEVSDTFDIVLNQDNFGYYAFEDKEDYLNNLEFYIGDFRRQVMELLEKYNLKEKYIVSEEKLQKRLNKVSEIKRNQLRKDEDNQNTSNLNEMKLQYSLNQILFGAPGTGKTYNTKRIAVEIINGEKQRTREEINTEYEDLVNTKQIVFTTFHQSLSYEDFIEGIKPIIFEDSDENKSVVYEIKNGIFKDLCQQAQIQSKVIKNEIENYDFNSAWNDLVEEINSFIQNEKIYELPILTLNKSLNVTEVTNNGNLRLKPKSNAEALEYTVSYNRAKKLQEAFPDLTLVKNIDKEFRSVIGGSNSTAYWSVLNYINNKISSNSKSRTAEKILPSKKHVLIVDEINRGNVSAIFGELITLLEEDKRKGNKEQTEVILPYSNEKFSVPNNVYLIGTMNTADRSVEALDTALRRRFSFIEMQPNPEILSNSEYKDVDLKQLLVTINQRIEVLVDKDHQIGHSYFIGIQNLEELKLVFKDKIIPLLEEYFYGDFGKIGLVLGASFIYQEENTAKFPKNFPYENDFLEDKKVYRFTSFENWNEQTFISVYKED